MNDPTRMTLASLQAHGFDQSEDDGEYCRVRCGRCEALVINGTPCHESGCPNQMHECDECMTLIPKRQRLCESCANPEPFPDDAPDFDNDPDR